jgi:putative ABC transport system permease protein
VVAPAGARGPARAAPDGHDADRTIFLPLQSLDLPLGAGDRGDAVERIVARVPARGDVVRTAASVTALLQARDGIGRGAFETIVPRELLRARLRAERTSRMTMFAFGALALVISGAGIANIMVASVTERSGEIGIRRALGARRSSIVAQFAAEALLLGLGGAPAGIVMGAAGAWIVAALAGWPVAVSTASLAIATALAAIVGLVAGLYPARLAASLTPIEALRSAGQG